MNRRVDKVEETLAKLTSISLENREILKGLQRFSNYNFTWLDLLSKSFLSLILIFNYRYWTTKHAKIDKFFPAKDNQTLLDFLADDDHYEERVDAFSAYISGICDPKETNYRTFSDKLMDLLFPREYIASHKWVSNK